MFSLLYTRISRSMDWSVLHCLTMSGIYETGWWICGELLLGGSMDNLWNNPGNAKLCQNQGKCFWPLCMLVCLMQKKYFAKNWMIFPIDLFQRAFFFCSSKWCHFCYRLFPSLTCKWIPLLVIFLKIKV